MSGNMHNKKNEEGIVLVLSLLLLGVVTAVGLGVSLVVINEVQSSIQVDESIVATYAAEAKVENALYIIQQRRLQPGTTLDDVVQDIKNPAIIDPDLNITTGAGTVQATVDLSKTKAGQAFLLTSLAQDQTVQFNVQTDDCFANPASATCVRSITFSGERLDVAGPEPWVELTEVAFSPTSISPTGATSVKKELIPETLFLDPSSPKTYNFIGDPPTISPINVQTLRLTALYNGVKNLEIRTYTEANPLTTCASVPCASEILGHININAIGKYGRAQIGSSASVPWRLPSSGLFDYVIFSEDTIKQD